MINKASPLTREQQLDEACDLFLSEWQPGKTPDFRLYLAEVGSELRADLLHRLLDIDLQLQLRERDAVPKIATDRKTMDALPQFSLETAQTRVPCPNDHDEEDESSFELPSQTIGPYHLMARIGAGGMGSVWRAEQYFPIRRTLAIKVIRVGGDSREVLARFETERQVLAMMDHPNIARIIDAGQTEDGAPYFAMELVDGEPITAWCDRRQMGLRERLELFANICDAVQHAHQKGIMHRDLKPSNILVTEYNGKPRPKIIDFGLAKATDRDHQLARRSQHTTVGQLVGTIRYMSPEQAELQTELLDTRTDVYSLGVLLYELLTGATPLDPKMIERLTLLQTLEQIRYDEPVRPSVRLRGFTNLCPQVLKCRNTTEAELNRVLVGELDWIVMKAIAKEPARRYQAVWGLATDVRRFIKGDPVLARPPSAGYRICKFVNRYRLGVISGSLIALILMAAAASTTWGMFRALEAERVAKSNQLQLKNANQFLTDIFSDLNLQERTLDSKPLESLLADRLIQAVDDIDAAEIGDPLAKANMNLKLGDSLVSLGHAEEAIQPLQNALDTRIEFLTWSDLRTQSAAKALGHAFQSAGNYDTAVSLLETTVDYNRRELGSRDRETLDSRRLLGICYRDAGEQSRAMKLIREVYELQAKLFGEDDPDTIESLAAIASCTTAKDQMAMYRTVFEWHLKKKGLRNLKTLTAKHDLAFSLLDAEEIPQSIQLFEELVATNKETLGHQHTNTLRALNCLASAYQAIKDPRALPMLEETMRLTVQKHGKLHRHSLQAMNRLAIAWRANGDMQKALPLYRETWDLRVKRFGESNTTSLISLNNLGYGYFSAGRYEEAGKTFRKAIRLTKIEFGEFGRRVFPPTNGLGITLAAQGQHQAALRTFESALDIGLHNFGIAHHDAQLATFNLAEQLWLMNRTKAYLKRLQANLVQIEKHCGKDHFLYVQANARLGRALAKCGQYCDAIAFLESSLGSPHFDNRLSWVWDQLIEACRQSDRIEDFYALIATHIRFVRAENSPDDLAKALQARAIDLLNVGDEETAKTLLAECHAIRESIDENSWKTSVSRYWLGKTLAAIEKPEEAEFLLRLANIAMSRQYEGLAAKHRPVAEDAMLEYVSLPESSHFPEAISGSNPD